jgi:hypothetical protein
LEASTSSARLQYSNFQRKSQPRNFKPPFASQPHHTFRRRQIAWSNSRHTLSFRPELPSDSPFIDLDYCRTHSLCQGALFLSTNNRICTTSPTVSSSYQPIFIQSQSWQLLLLPRPLVVMPNPHLQLISQLFLFRPTAQTAMMRTRTPTERVVQARNKSQFSMTRITSMLSIP